MFTLALLILSPSMASTSHVLGKRIDEVTLQAVEGDVRVVVDPEARRIEIDTVDHRPGHTCSFQRVEAGRTATITFGPKALESATDCRMDFTIRLRPEVQLSVDLGLGRIDVRDVATDLKISVHRGDVHLTDVGAVTLAVGEGDVALDNVDGPTVITVDKGHLHGSQTGALTASVREGQINLKGLDAPVSAQTDIGSILLGYRSVPEEGLRLNAGMGNIVVDLPPGTTVRSDLTSARGLATCELPPGNDLHISAVAGMGSILVR